MIVRITLIEKGKEFTMLFGDSYKKWHVQFQEYVYRFHVSEVISLQTCNDKWKSWGGLKWCQDIDFQGELNTEGCQSSEPNNPNPRLYSNMVFEDNKKYFNKANNMVMERLKYHNYRSLQGSH
jgi:hypothetical protein